MNANEISEYLKTALPWVEFIWKNKDVLLPQMRRVRDWFRADIERDGRLRRILIIGAGGCGKSTLGLLLSGKLDYLEHVPSTYAESIFTDTLALKDDPQVEVIIPPGQEHRRPSTWNAIHDDLANGGIRGIMLVNSYGYHSVGDISYTEHKLYPAAGNQTEFLKSYLADRRNEELRVLKQLEPYVTTCPQPIWLMSVINKEDLWWDKKAEVITHYKEGRYGTIIGSIRQALGMHRSFYETVYMSLIIGSLTTGRGERLAGNVAGYDTERQVQSIRAALDTLEAVQRWEASQ